LFTSILNERIVTYCDKYNVISDAQFGFRRGLSKTDAIFSLHSLVQHFLQNKQRLYVAFVDLKKCFDSIYRNGLWFKLYKSSIDGKVLRIIRNMYTNVKSRVKQCNDLSDFIEYSVGLRQGEVLSPALVSLFLEDLELFLQNDTTSGLKLFDIVLIILMFADDMCILSETPEGLQSSLNRLYEYCQNWGIEVNSSKTKVMVFRKRGKVLDNEQWTYGGNILENVDSFNYLGTVFNYTGSFNLNNEYIVGKALKALNVLLANCKKMPLKPKLLCQLFDSFVGSILSYAAEVWGYTKAKEIERIHLKFCKRILNVPVNSCSAAVYGELGRHPLYINWHCKIINYWCKLQSTDNIILKSLYRLSLDDFNKGYTNWVANVKCILDNQGMSYMFNSSTGTNVKVIPRILKQSLIDTHLQNWRAIVDRSPVLSFYRNVKSSIQYEAYLDILPCNLRFLISRFRISAHSLRIQSGRFARNRIDRHLRICQLCEKHDIEDEFHMILVCPSYMSLRKKYIKKNIYTRPSVYKLVELFKSENRSSLLNLSIFLKEAVHLRTSLLNRI